MGGNEHPEEVLPTLLWIAHLGGTVAPRGKGWLVDGMVRCLNGFANSFVLIDFDESLTSRYFFILRVSRVGYEMRMLRITTVSTAVPLLGSFVF